MIINIKQIAINYFNKIKCSTCIASLIFKNNAATTADLNLDSRGMVAK